MGMRIIAVILLGLACTPLALQGQQADTLATEAEAEAVPDTAEHKGNWFSRDYPNPKKAGLLSLMIPGAGQLYNKRWWKLPFVYGALTGMALVVDFNQSNYRRLRDALDLKRMDQPHEFSGTTLDNTRTLRSLRDQYDKNTQLAYVGMFLVYTLQAMEAFVDAHLKGFDVDDDLGFRIKPQAELIAPLGQPVIGMGVSIPLYKKPLGKPARNVLGR